MKTQYATERLLLRKPCPTDAESIFDMYATDKRVTRYLAWSPHSSISVTEEFLKTCAAGWKSGTWLSWVLELDDHGVIGMIDLHEIRDSSCFLGFVLARAFWGQSLMTEAATHIVQEARAEGLSVWSYTYPENVASIQVLKNIGMRNRGIRQSVMSLPNLDSSRKLEGLLFEAP